jgi:hypothetical protein
MERNNLNNVTTQGSLENLKRLIESRDFDQARLTITTLKDAKNISDEEIKRRLIQLGTDNQSFTFFFDNYERVNTQLPVEPSAPPPLPEPSAPPPLPEPSAPPPLPEPSAPLPLPEPSAPQEFMGKLPSPKSPNKKRPSNKKNKSGLPVIRRSSSGLRNSLPNPKSPNKKRPSNKKNKSGLPSIRRRSSGLRNSLSGSKSPNKKRPSNKKKSDLPVITRRPSLKRSLSSSKKGNKQTKKRKL